MKVLILSTETKHHTYFINKLAAHFEIAGVIYERRKLTKAYPTGPFFDGEQDAFEDRFFDPVFDGTASKLPSSIAHKVIEVYSVNRRALAAYIKALGVDAAVSFGTGLIKPYIYNAPQWGTINVHRGIAEHYRGLDSDLWAIYERRFDRVGATIHTVDEDLDTGHILAQECVSIDPEDEIYHLRYKTTIVATQLVIDVLSRMGLAQELISGRIQEQAGSYYSAMPLDVKHETLSIFQTYRDSLRG